MWGARPSRNMVSAEKGLPDDVRSPASSRANTEEIDMATTKNVKWVAKLGSQSYGNPTVAGGKIFVGTNNERRATRASQGDRGVLMCLDEKTGKFLWQLAVPKLGAGRSATGSSSASAPRRPSRATASTSSPTAARSCASTSTAWPTATTARSRTKASTWPARASRRSSSAPTDADIIWRFDMRDELGVFPHNITNCGPLIVGDKLVVTHLQRRGLDAHQHPDPKAPCLWRCSNKNTGELLGEEASRRRAAHPALQLVVRRATARSTARSMSSSAAATALLRLRHRAGEGRGRHQRPQGALALRLQPAGVPDEERQAAQVRHRRGPQRVIATPVFYKNRVYVAIGQDPEHGEGVGNLVCIDATKTGDITKTGMVWSYDKIAPLALDAVHRRRPVFVADFSGFVHCLDAETGKPYWVHDTKSHIWGSTLVADGKVYVGTEDGDLVILAAARTMKEIGEIDMGRPVYSSPVVANGTSLHRHPTAPLRHRQDRK